MAITAFYAALVLYAFFSSPTPDNLGWAEFVIAFLLIASLGITKLWNGLTSAKLPAFLSLHRIFIIYMLSIPLIIGGLNAYSAHNIIRDLIPLALLVLPLCFYKISLPMFEYLLAGMGSLFAVRYLAVFIPFLPDQTEPLLYLANSPLLPFAAVYGFHMFSCHSSSSIIYRVIGLACCLLCFIAMALMLQRAPFFLSTCGCLAIFALRATYRPITSMVIGILVLMMIFFVVPAIEDIFNSFRNKTLSVGLNNRIEEWNAVLMHTTLFGHGWGAVWQSPAVADIWVRYTHNIVSYYWFKAGVIGGVICLGFIYLWGRQILLLCCRNTALGIAILIPFTIHITLYTGFKTLDFALLLTLLTNRICRSNQKQSLS
jgi:hypothetical protein